MSTPTTAERQNASARLNLKSTGGRCEYIRRAIRLVTLLQSRKWITINEMAEEWGCDPKTARRWLDSAEQIMKLVVDYDSQGNPGLPRAFYSLPRR